MADPNNFDRLVRNLDSELKKLERRIAAGEVTSQPAVDMAKGLREALDRYFQSGNDGNAK